MATKNYGSKGFGKDKNTEVLATLKSQLKDKNLGKVYLFHGNEPFLIDFYVGELKKTVLGKDIQGLNFTTFENKVDSNDLIDACDTYPVFAERKLVLVKNSSLFYNKTKKEAPVSGDDGVEDREETEQADLTAVGNKAQETLKQYLSDIPETTCLIFVESQVDKRLGLYKQVVKVGLPVEFTRLGERELIPWVAKGFKTMGKVITQEGAQHLVTISEPDMYTLKNEIFKLDAYTGDRKEITLEDVKLMATPTIKSVIFDLLDAISQKNAPRALTLLSDMLSLKEPEQKILSMLSKQTGEILKLKYLLKKGASQLQINQYFQGKHPYALKMMINQAQGMDEKYLKKLLKSCMEAETSYKKGLMGAKLSIEVLLSKIGS